MDTDRSSTNHGVGSMLVRLFCLGLFVLVLEIPVRLIDNLVSERMQRRTEAMTEISQKWGKEQVVSGPMLAVPFIRQHDNLGNGAGEHGHIVVLPEDLAITGMVRSERRRRGLFEVPVYAADLTLTGHFAPPDLAAFGLQPEDIDWSHAQLAVRVGDTRALQAGLEVHWNDEKLPVAPSTGLIGGSPSGLHVDLGERAHGQALSFKVVLGVHGAVDLAFLPLGRNTRVDLTADWPHPSFSGAALPVSRTIESGGFEANWEVSYLARDYPQAWLGGSMPEDRLDTSRFGVTLFSPVDAYVVTQRSVKYASLFLVLTFMTIWLIDIMSNVMVHPIQYLMVGSAMCLFYLLELAFAEHIGVARAYAVAAVAVTLLNSAYCLAVLGRARRAAAVATLLTTLYTFLYTVLQREQYALLLGSIGLFLALAGLMFITRNVNWYRLGMSPESRSDKQPSLA